MTGGLRVSVVIPALDEEAALPAAIRSARAAGADEVIVVDGGSADATVRIATSEADRCLAAPRGRATQMNAGARAAAGEILLFLHADTRLPQEGARAVRQAVESGAVGGAFRVRLEASPGAGAYTRALLRLTGPMIGVRARLARSYTGDQAIFVRSDLFRRLGGFPEIPLMEDVVLSRAMARAGPTRLLPQAVATSARRWEAGGPIRTILLMWGLRIAHLLGMPPARCARIYSRGSPGGRESARPEGGITPT